MEQKSKKLLRRYPGAKPFDESEWRQFNGREQDISNLLERIKLHNLNVLFGRSGLGKSSLLRAGLMKQLREESGTFATLHLFGPYYKENSISPVQKLIDVIKADSGSSETYFSEKFALQSAGWNNQLWYLLKNHQIAQPEKDTFLLILDQFEEVFSYPDEEVREFKKMLSELMFVKMPQQIRDAINEQLSANKEFLTREQTAQLFSPLSVKILFAIAADKLSLLNNLTDYFPGVLQSCYELKPLTKAQARLAIEAPAAIDDSGYLSPQFTIRPDLVDLIITALSSTKDGDTSTDEIEPFQLQLVCKRIEDIVIDRDDIDITAEDLGNIRDIFEQYYIECIRKLPADKQLPARRLIEEKLIVDGGRVPLPVKFIMRDEGITADLLESLVESHILKPEQNNTVEVSHDTFVDPIMKFYQERRREELLAEEQIRKDEQIRQLREEQEALMKEQRRQQELELQRLEAKRNRMKMNYSIGIGLAVALLLAGAYIRRQINDNIEHNISDKRRKAYKLSGRANDTLRFDPTAALALKIQSLGTFDSSDKDNISNVQKNIDSIRNNYILYKIVYATRPETYVTISDDAKLIITGNYAGLDSVWAVNDAGGSKLLARTRTSGVVKAACCSHNGKYVLMYTADDRLKKWDLKTGNCYEIARPGIPVRYLQCSPDDTRFLAITAGNKLFICDSSGHSLHELRDETIRCGIFSRNGDTLLTGSQSGDAMLWTAEGNQISTYHNWKAPLTALAFTPHGGRFIYGNEKGFASMWHRNGTDRPLLTFGDLGCISSVSVIGYFKDSLSVYDPRKKTRYSSVRICTGDTSGVVKIWYVKYASGDFLDQDQDPEKNFNMMHWYSNVAGLKGHRGRVNRIAKLNPSTLVTCSADGTVRAWDISRILKDER